MSKPTVLPFKGLRVLAILFRHPTESMLTPFHQERAKALGLKYAVAFYVDREGEVEVRTRLVPDVGMRISRTLGVLPVEPDTLVNAVACSIDDAYATLTQARLYDDVQSA